MMYFEIMKYFTPVKITINVLQYVTIFHNMNVLTFAFAKYKQVSYTNPKASG